MSHKYLIEQLREFSLEGDGGGGDVGGVGGWRGWGYFPIIAACKLVSFRFW